MNEKTSSIKVSRRRLLKFLAASGAAVGLARLLPARWATPVAAQVEDGCLPDACDIALFPLTLNTTRVDLLSPDSSVAWKISFGFNDSAGLLTNSSALSAVLNDSGGELTPLVQLEDLANLAGTVDVLNNQSYPTPPDCLVNSGRTIYLTNGRGSFEIAFDLTDPNLAAVLEENPTLLWNLTDSCGRESNLVETSLVPGPVAVTLSDLVAESAGVGNAAKVAAAGTAALGAATAYALRKGREPDGEES